VRNFAHIFFSNRISLLNRDCSLREIPIETEQVD
jgi:hypothetical protein